MKGVYEETLWRVVDSHWTCIERTCRIEGLKGESHVLPAYCLAQYLWLLGFNIPDTIEYCLARNKDCKLKYRNNGGTIHIFVSPNK